MSAMYEYKPSKKSETREKLIETVSKLLYQDGRPEAEAASFAKKAMTMMVEHGITLTEIEAAAKPAADDADIVDSPSRPMPNVRRFLAAEYEHPDHRLLVQQGGQFYRWDGTCWPALEDSMLKSGLYKWFEHKRYMQADALVPFSPTTSKINNLMDATRGITIIATNKETPSWLSARSTDPADEMISCKNGLIHWPTRTLSAYHPAYYVHHSVPFAFDAKAPSPERWLKFLNELWPDDQSSIATLQEMFGYLVSGDTRLQKMFMLVGPMRAGKGTIARVLERMIGEHNVGGQHSPAWDQFRLAGFDRQAGGSDLRR